MSSPEVVAELAHPAPAHVDPFDLARADVMLAGYDARWAADMDRYEVLGVELEFTAPVRNPETGMPSRTWILGGKLDVRIREHETNSVLIVEHKTTSLDAGPGSDYLKRLRMDGQVTVYYAGAESLGEPVDGCLYDVLIKPGQRPLKATPADSRKYTKEGRLYANQRERDETPDEYRDRLTEAVSAEPNDFFLRARVVRLEHEMRDGMADVWQTGRAIRESILANSHPRNPGACVRYGRTCEFFGVCCGEASLSDERLFRRSAGIHSELELGQTEQALLTTSRLTAYRTCPRLHKLRYLDGYRPAVEAETLRFGTLIHVGLEAWWRGEPGARLDAARDRKRRS
jgi:hypothetical protein